MEPADYLRVLGGQAVEWAAVQQDPPARTFSYDFGPETQLGEQRGQLGHGWLAGSGRAGGLLGGTRHPRPAGRLNLGAIVCWPPRSAGEVPDEDRGQQGVPVH